MKLAFSLLAVAATCYPVGGHACEGLVVTTETRLLAKPREDAAISRVLKAGTPVSFAESLLGVHGTTCARRETGDYFSVFVPDGFPAKTGKYGWVKKPSVQTFVFKSLGSQPDWGDLFEKASQVQLKSNFAIRLAAEPRGGAEISKEAYDILFALTGRGLSLVLRNKGSRAVKIKWDESAFVGTDGKSQRVIHTGIRLVRRDEAQPPSMVPPNATLEDEVVPASSVSFYADRWNFELLFDPSANPIGKTLGVMLAIEIGGTTEYENGVFEIISAKTAGEP
jgi:hypothetical protein